MACSVAYRAPGASVTCSAMGLTPCGIRGASGSEVIPAHQGDTTRLPLRPPYRLRQFAAKQR